MGIGGWQKRKTRTHAWRRIGKSFCDSTFRDGNVVQKDIWRVCGDQMVDVHSLGLWIAVDASNQLAIILHGPIMSLERGLSK